MRALRIVVVGCALSCESPPTALSAASPPVAPVDAGSVANEPAHDPPAPIPDATHFITVENETGDARFEPIARAAIDPKLAREVALQRYALVVIIQPFEIDGPDLRVRLTTRVRDVATGRLVGEIPVSLKLEGGAADRGGPAADDLVARAAARIADQLIAYFSKPDSDGKD